MAAFISNIAKGRFARYADLPETADALIWVLFASSGLEADSVLKDKNDLAAVVAGTTAEATFAGYARQTATAVVVTTDDTNDRVDVDCADPQFNPTAAEAIGKVMCCYDGDTGVGTDANIVPLFMDDLVMTTAVSGTLDYQVAAAGFGRAS